MRRLGMRSSNMGIVYTCKELQSSTGQLKAVVQPLQDPAMPPCGALLTSAGSDPKSSSALRSWKGTNTRIALIVAANRSKRRVDAAYPKSCWLSVAEQLGCPDVESQRPRIRPGLRGCHARHNKNRKSKPERKTDAKTILPTPFGRTRKFTRGRVP